ncbi:glycosyltransferase family protein, partial [Lysobacter xanthus]
GQLKISAHNPEQEEAQEEVEADTRVRAAPHGRRRCTPGAAPMSRIAVYTSAADNYLPKVRALAESVRAFHPEWAFHLARADRPPAAATESFAIHELDTLGIPNWRAWAFCHDLMELATAIKPFLLRKLLAEYDAVVYLDPDVLVLAPLRTVEEGFASADILLTPHQTSPDTTEREIIANEVCTLQHGVYNLGFIAVAARGDGPAMADWWAQRTYRYCRADIPNGIFTDQRWIDLVPAFFDGVRVLRSPRLNVAPWNLSTRRVDADGEGRLSVEGAPMEFFHFSQVDAGQAFGDGQAPVARLTEAYREATRTAGPRAPWSLSRYDDGGVIGEAERLVFRLRSDLQQAFPDPYATGLGSFRAWWQQQAPLEYPALFDAARVEAELALLRSALTTGYAPLVLTPARA